MNWIDESGPLLYRDITSSFSPMTNILKILDTYVQKKNISKAMMLVLYLCVLTLINIKIK